MREKAENDDKEEEKEGGGEGRRGREEEDNIRKRMCEREKRRGRRPKDGSISGGEVSRCPPPSPPSPVSPALLQRIPTHFLHFFLSFFFHSKGGRSGGKNYNRVERKHSKKK